MDLSYGPFLPRKLAQEKGLSYYYIGTICLRGHIAQHRVGGGCFQCLRERAGYTGKKSRHGRCPVKYAAKRKRTAAKTLERRATEEGRLRRNEVERARYARLSTSEKLAPTLRARVREALRWSGAQKSKSTMDLVGCSIPELRKRLTQQFLPGMTWDNYGEWHIDHIRPCASFDLTDPEQQKQCFHYSNLQPLWAADNLRKEHQ